MLSSMQSLSVCNPALAKAFDDVFSPTDLALSAHRASCRRFPLGDLIDSELANDWGILGDMPDGQKNWTEG